VQIRLVDEGRGLLRLPGRLVGQTVRGQPAQFVGGQRQEPRGGSRVAGLDSVREDRDVGHWAFSGKRLAAPALTNGVN
jgi:hypothetical protein